MLLQLFDTTGELLPMLNYDAVRRFFRGSDREIECYKEEQRNDSERLTQQVSFGDVGQCETQEEGSGFSSRVCVCQFSGESNGESGQRFMQKVGAELSLRN